MYEKKWEGVSNLNFYILFLYMYIKNLPKKRNHNHIILKSDKCNKYSIYTLKKIPRGSTPPTHH